ncbi:MAG: glutamate--cysteine ligase [Alphaproteobacteria bacterium]|nr:glutamate--cysteine ligase [Alphaproteobacteria bacterium]
MSTREETAAAEPISSKDDLVSWLAEGCKSKEAWRIGTEHEKFVFNTADRTPVPYDGPSGINALMRSMIECCGWEPIEEAGNIIALKKAPGEAGGTISLEPGGQFELSGAPLATVHETCAETGAHLREVLRVGELLGIGFLGLGFSPKWTLKETPLMPKPRYDIMMDYMPRVGSRGLDMMFRTTTIQVNLDFSDEADMVKKLRVSLALQPIATALFASSPFTEGRPNGFKSMRSEVWRDTDPHRTGILPFAFEEGMGFERYVDYALDVPMYFVYRNGRYLNAVGASFRDFIDGNLAILPGEKATLDDWSDHLTTLFPEVRLKRFLEMRGADGGRWDRICALPAFWAGLLYDETALAAASDLIADWTIDECQRLRDQVPRLALQTPFRSTTVQALARQVLGIAKQGLVNRAVLNSDGRDETIFLATLEDIVASGRTVADELLAHYHGRWQNRIEPVFEEYAF